jgi:hypothetical protein
VQTFAQSKNTEKIKSCSTPTNHPPPTKPRPTHQKPPLSANKLNHCLVFRRKKHPMEKESKEKQKGEQEQRKAEEEKSSKIYKKGIQDKKNEGIT